MESAKSHSSEQASVPVAPSEELSEFDDFLSDLGAEPSAPRGESDSVLKDATIAELTARLQDLQVLGDQLAATERERLSAVARVEELEAAAATEPKELATPSPDAQTEQLEKEVRSLGRARDRQTERLDRMRTKFEERKRVAADRWRELLELKRELKALKRSA